MADHPYHNARHGRELEAQDIASAQYALNIRGHNGFLKGWEHFEPYTRAYEDELVEAAETIEELTAEVEHRPATANRSTQLYYQ